ncbi:MAG: hypothetical protein OHK0040_08100 [bacterium]
MKKIATTLAILICSLLFMGQVGIKSFEHDFGKVKPDEYVYHTFEIENSTEGNLIIQSVQAG